MLICAAGDIHGALDRMFEDVLAFEAMLGGRFEWVLHVGDFGIWPDPGLFYLRNGVTRELEAGGEIIRVAGVGGCYGPSDYDRPSSQLQGYAKRHYTRDEIDGLCDQGVPVDILLVHDAPAGVLFERHRRGVDWVSPAAGLDELVARVRPRVCFFGHYHRRVDAEIGGVRCIGLNLVRRPGNLVAIEFDPTSHHWSVVGEWPSRAD